MHHGTAGERSWSQKRPSLTLGEIALPPRSPSQLLRDVTGPTIYAIRLHNMVKIGYTENLARRIRSYPIASLQQLLLVRPGSKDEERAIHERFRPFTAAGREWYAPAPHLMRWIDEQRALLNIPPLSGAA